MSQRRMFDKYLKVNLESLPKCQPRILLKTMRQREVGNTNIFELIQVPCPKPSEYGFIEFIANVIPSTELVEAHK